MANPTLLQYDVAAYLVTGSSITSNAFTTQNTTVGSTILVWIALDEDAAPTVSVVDSNGQSYSQVPASSGGVNVLYEAAGPSFFCVYQFANNQFANKPTVTATWSGSNSALNIHCEEWGNVPTTGADGCNFVYQTTPGTSANAITVPATPNNAVSGYGISAVTSPIAGTVGGNDIAAGTNFALTTTFYPTGAYGYTTFEQAYLTGTGTQTATFTDASYGGTADYLSGIVLFDGPASTANNQPLLLLGVS